MSVDVMGALRAPQAPTAAQVESGTAGDPSLDVITDYLRTFLNDRLAPLWAAVAPAPPPGPRVPLNAGDVVRSVLHHDPAADGFNEKDLPALYLRRRRGRPAWMAEDYRVSTDDFSLVWVFPPMPQAGQRIRARMVSAIGAAVDAGIERMRFWRWLHARDLADASAILLPKATATAAAEWAGAELDGAVGSRRLPTPRRITLSATAALGAYSLSPLTVEGFDAAGAPVAEQVTPPSVDGGWLLTTDTAFLQVTRVAAPAQATTAGSLQVGHEADADALAYGSPLLLHAGLMSLKVVEWAETFVTITVTGAEGRSTAQRYPAVEVTLQGEQRWTIEDDDDIAPLEGIDIDFTNGDDGVLIEQAFYE